MMRRRIVQPRLFFLILLIAGLSCGSCTIKKLNELDQDKETDEYSTWTKSGKEFNPVEYVNSIWDEKVIPIFMEESVEIHAVLEVLLQDKEKALQEYGLTRPSGEKIPAFKVKGMAEVLKYDDSSRNGLLVLDLQPTDGQEDVLLQIGPVIRQTAIRDSLDFIRFTDVGNQLQFASLADQLNLRMRKESVEPLDLENISGKNICFYGAIKLEEDQEVQTLKDYVVTPVKIEMIEAEESEND